MLALLRRSWLAAAAVAAASTAEAASTGEAAAPVVGPVGPVGPVAAPPRNGSTAALKLAATPGDWLYATNMYRCMHNAKSVTWSEAAAESAQQFVNKLSSMEHSDSYHEAPPAGPAGENEAMGYSSVWDTVEAWYNTVSCCQSWPGCETTSCEAGSFTALVWAGVSEIGCAMNTKNNIYICRYRSGDTLGSWTANMGGYYQQNVFQQSKTADWCRKQLQRSASPWLV